MRHLEILGVIMMLIGPIGWAKPVPVDASQFKHRKLYTVLTVAAGPFSNLILALIFFAVLRFSITNSSASIAIEAVSLFITVNLSLLIFNIIPVPPLDGYRILDTLLPVRHQFALRKLELYGPFVLLLLFITPAFSNAIFVPIINSLVVSIGHLYGMSLVL
jgi:Zn-dependent protease